MLSKNNLAWQFLLLIPLLSIIQISNVFQHDNLTIKVFLLSFYLICVINLPYLSSVKYIKVPCEYQNTIIIFIVLILFIGAKVGIFHRTYVGFIILFLMIYAKNFRILFVLLVILFFNNNKISLLSGILYFGALVWDSKYLYGFFKKSIFLISGFVFIFMIVYITMGHWYQYIEAGNIDRIHAINHRLSNYETILGLFHYNHMTILFPFDFRLINDEAMDSGILVVLYRSGLLVMIVSFYFFIKNIIHYYDKKSLIIFLVPLLTQAAYFNPIILLVIIILMLLLNTQKQILEYKNDIKS